MLNENKEKHFPPQIYVNLTEPERELHSIRLLCLDESLNALVYLSSLHPRAAETILSSLIRSSPPHKTLFLSENRTSTAEFHWLCFSISRILKFDKLKYDFFSIYTHLLSEQNQAFAQNIMKMLSNPNNTEITLKDIESFILFHLNSPQLCRCFESQFDNIFSKIDVNKIFNQYQYNVLSIFNIEKLEPSLIKFEEHEDLFKIIQKIFIKSPEYFTKVQQLFFDQNPFPQRTFFCNSSILASLFNTAAARKTHFIDVCAKLSIRCLKIEKDIKNSFEMLALFPQLQSWAVCAVYDLRNDQTEKQNEQKEPIKSIITPFFQEITFFLSDILELLPKNLKTDISHDFLNRVYNDNQFFIRVSQITGENMNYSMFYNTKNQPKKIKSIPLFFIHYLNKKGELFNYNDLYSTPLFIYGDEMRIKDLDFISAYFAIVNEINCFLRENDIENYLLNFSKSLSLMKNPELVIVDLFSLLFLQINNHFVCGAETAAKIIPILSDYIVSEPLLSVFKAAVKKVQFSNLLLYNSSIKNINKPLKNNNKLDKTLIPYSSLFDLALLSHEWGIAHQLEALNPKYAEKTMIFQKVTCFKELNENPKLAENSFESFMIASEIGLSFDNQREFINFSLSYINKFNNSQISWSNKGNQNCDFYEDLNENPCIYNVLYKILNERKVNPLKIVYSGKISGLANKLRRLSSTTWQITVFDESQQSCKTIRSFFEYLDNFVPCVLESKLTETVFDALSTPPRQLLFDLFNKDNIETAKKIAKAINLDIVEALLIFSADHKDQKFPLIEEYPIVNISDYAFSGDGIKKDSEYHFPEKFESIFNVNSKYKKIIEDIKKMKENNKFVYYRLKKTFTSMPSPLNLLDAKDEEKKKEILLYFGIDSVINESILNKIDDNINMPQKYFQNCILDLLNNKSNDQMNVDLISDLSYRVPNEFFEETVKKLLPSLNLDEVSKLVEISNCTDTLHEAVSILQKISYVYKPVFPLENSFKFLLSTGTFSLAKKLCSHFRYQMKTAKAIREVALSLLYKEKSIEHVLGVCPQIKQEIIESLPSRFKEKVVQNSAAFFRGIPKSWKVCKDPRVTFIRNLNNEEEAIAVFKEFPFINIDRELMMIFQHQIASTKLANSKSSPNSENANVFIKNNNGNKIDTNINGNEERNKDDESISSAKNNTGFSIAETVQFLSTNMKKLLKFFRNPSEPCQLVCKQIINYVSQIKVSSREDEENASEYVYKAFSALNDIKNLIFSRSNNGTYVYHQLLQSLFFEALPKFCEKMRVLSSFISCFLNIKYDLCYSFQNFESAEKALQFFDTAFQYDLPEIAFCFAKTWNLNQSTDDYALKLFKLGIFDEGIEYCEDRRNKNSLRTMNIVSSFVDVCNYSQVFDPTQINMIANCRCKNHAFSNFNSKSNPILKIKKNVNTITSTDANNELNVNINADGNANVNSFLNDDANNAGAKKNQQKRTITNSYSMEIKFKDLTIEEMVKTFDIKSLFVVDPHIIRTSEASLRAANIYMKEKAPLFMRVKKLVINGNFDKAIKLVMKSTSLPVTIEPSSGSDQTGLPKSFTFESTDSPLVPPDSPLMTPDNENGVISNYNSNNKYNSTNSQNNNNNSESNNNVFQDRWNLFLDSVFVVSISYSYLAKMKVKLLEFDPNLEFFGSLTEKLLLYTIENSMHYLKFELEMFLGRTDSAAVTAIQLYKTYHNIGDLENAQKAVAKDIKMRKNATKKAPNSIQMDVIEGYNRIIPLQINFIKFINKKIALTQSKYNSSTSVENESNGNINNNHNHSDNDNNNIQINSKKGNNTLLNKKNKMSNKINKLYNFENMSLFNGRKPAMTMVIFLFTQNNFMLGLEIMSTCELNVLQTADAFCDVLVNESAKSILKLIRGIEDSAPDEIFLKMLNRLLLRMHFVFEVKNVTEFIIERCIKNEEYKTKLLIQFGFYDKAFENAKKWKLFYLLPLIAHEIISKDQSFMQIAVEVKNLLPRLPKSPSREFPS